MRKREEALNERMQQLGEPKGSSDSEPVIVSEGDNDSDELPDLDDIPQAPPAPPKSKPEDYYDEEDGDEELNEEE